MLLKILVFLIFAIGMSRCLYRLFKGPSAADFLYLAFWISLASSYFVSVKGFIILPLILLVTSQILKRTPKDSFSGDEQEPGHSTGESKRPFQLSKPPPPRAFSASTESEPAKRNRDDDFTDSPEDFIKQIPEIAEECVLMSKQLLNYDLDYSPESLSKVDELITETWNGEYALPVGGLAVQFGSYVGEVIRRNIGGRWDYDEGDSYILVDLGNGVLRANVFSKAYRRLANGEGDSLAFFYRCISSQEKDSAS